MKVLVVYDSVSPMKLTQKVAETIANVLKEKGVEVDSVFVGAIDKATVNNYDCVIAGAPTMAFRATQAMTKFLDGFSDGQFSGKRAASFDTQLQSRFSGNAAEKIEKKLKKLGFELIAAPLVAYVAGKSNAMQFKDGELEKTKTWAQELVDKLSK